MSSLSQPDSLTPGRNNLYLQGYLLVILAAVTYGLQPLFTHFAYADGASPGGLLLLRYSFAFLMMFTWLQWRRIPLPRGKGFIQSLLIGVSYSAAAIGYYNGSQSTSVSLAVILMFSFPAFVTLYSIAVLKQPARRSRIMSMLLGLGGVILAAGTDLHGDLGGILWGLFAALSYGTAIVYGSHNMQPVNPVAASCVIMFGGVLTLGLSNLIIPGDLPATGDGWLTIALLALFATILPVACFIKGSPNIGAATASTLSTIEPVVAISIAVLLIGEPITLPLLLAGFMVLTAAACLARR